MDSKQNQNHKAKNNNKKKSAIQKNKEEISFKNELLFLVIIGIGIVVMLGNFNLAGVGNTGGNWISRRLFGLFGMVQYILPVFFIISSCFCFVNRNNKKLYFKIAAVFFVQLVLCALIELLKGTGNMEQKFISYYENGCTEFFSGGIAGGCLANFVYSIFGVFASVIILLLVLIGCIVFLTERSFVKGVEFKSRKVYESAKEDIDFRKQLAQQRRQERMEQRPEGEKASGGFARRKQKSANGMSEVSFELPKKNRIKSAGMDDIHEVFSEEDILPAEQGNEDSKPGMFTIQRGDAIREVSFQETAFDKEQSTGISEAMEDDNAAKVIKRQKRTAPKKKAEEVKEQEEQIVEEIQQASEQKTFRFEAPSMELLKRSKAAVQESDDYLSKTGMKLQQTLQSFGVNVTVTNVSCGPSVTRYELQPEQGVKVSRIVSLADDIKLNLAVADIRIEAPIPGKAAVGIEVPNRETSPVLLRELLESKEFAKSPSPLTFAVGKDIAGKVIVADIAKMPHLLIAGATGSGKSVCINTLIMSILYKADPEKVKLIMVDPKVVELSVYNGIPHMFIPVVTDPKKAAGALNWAVSEMTDRYKKFADLNVRDLKGYNAKVEQLPEDQEDRPQPLPQIVIIVDELADLMMVSKNEVEDAICRLAQLARAAGIHLILATQRPSVDVITGLIKANMPSRIAFSVSSGVDSRTIIDINGAEKLLGKGDMLFYPSGYPKPVRVQGAFISDKEVSDVTSFLTEQNKEVVYNQEIEERMNSIPRQDAGHSESESIYDEYFADAGKFVIEKDKGSIGMLQRVFKIGFNRAARIMDQLEEAGVVGEEEGTKPRRVLMSMEEFQAFIDESV